MSSCDESGCDESSCDRLGCILQRSGRLAPIRNDGFGGATRVCTKGDDRPARSRGRAMRTTGHLRRCRILSQCARKSPTSDLEVGPRIETPTVTTVAEARVAAHMARRRRCGRRPRAITAVMRNLMWSTDGSDQGIPSVACSIRTPRIITAKGVAWERRRPRSCSGLRALRLKP